MYIQCLWCWLARALKSSNILFNSIKFGGNARLIVLIVWYSISNVEANSTGLGQKS